jgi:hypothetical protein
MRQFLDGDGFSRFVRKNPMCCAPSVKSYGFKSRDETQEPDRNMALENVRLLLRGGSGSKFYKPRSVRN